METPRSTSGPSPGFASGARLTSDTTSRCELPGVADSRWLASARCRRTLPAQHHGAEHQRRPVPARRVDGAIGGSRATRKCRRAPSSSLPTASCSRSRAGRPHALQHEQPAPYMRGVSDRGGALRKLGTAFDGDVSVDFWSRRRDGLLQRGHQATNAFFALDVKSGAVRKLTSLPASLTVSRDDDTGVLLVNYSDRRRRTRCTPWPRSTACRPRRRGRSSPTHPGRGTSRWARAGDHVEVEGRKTVGGILVLPVGYRQVSAIRCGRHPRRARVGRRAGFNGGMARRYAGAATPCSSPTTAAHELRQRAPHGIVGNYFEPGYNDIMTAWTP